MFGTPRVPPRSQHPRLKHIINEKVSAIQTGIDVAPAHCPVSPNTVLMRLDVLLAVGTLTYMCTLPGESGHGPKCSRLSAQRHIRTHHLQSQRSTRCGCSRPLQPRKRSKRSPNLPPTSPTKPDVTPHQSVLLSRTCVLCIHNHAYLLPFKSGSGADTRSNHCAQQRTRYTQNRHTAHPHLLHNTIPSLPTLFF